MQGCRALCIGVHSERVIARKLALRGIGADTRPVFGHDLLDLEGAVARRIGDGIDVAGLGGLGNSYRSAVVRSSVCIDILVIDFCFDYAVLDRHVLTLVTHRKRVWHLEREAVERPLPIAVLIQYQGLTRGIHPGVRAVCLLHFLADRVGPAAVADLLLQLDSDRIAFMFLGPVCPHLLHLDVGAGIVFGGHGIVGMVDIPAVIRCAVRGHLE